MVVEEVQNDAVDVEKVPSSPAPAPTGKGKRRKVVTRIKLSNFNPDEDVNIVQSWLEIICDPITSTAQKKDRKWDRILQQYNLRRGSYPERSPRSLQSRWEIIKAEVRKFSSFYADAIRENPSGMSDADKTTHAAANFASILKHNFGFMHCWNIMKDEPKWQDPKPRASAGGDGFREDAINLGDENSSPTGSAGKRPMSRDSAKAAKKKANSFAGSTPAPTGKGKRRKVVTRIKLGNFKPDEDVNIVQSWLEIRCDPITSTAQKMDRMWDRILQLYNLRRGSYPERSPRSLQSRWEIIKAEVRKFSSFYADAIRENPSGMSDADKTTHAAANFASTLKRYFGFMHCWNIMKDEPKWQDPKPRASARGDGFREDTTNLGDENSSPTRSAGKRPMGRDSARASAGGDGFREDTINLGDENSSPTGSAGKRPMGRDSARASAGDDGFREDTINLGDENSSPTKAAKKKANSSAGSTSLEYASRMQDLSLQKISSLQEESMRKNDHFHQLACIDEKGFEEMRSYNKLLLECEQEKIRIMREKHDMDRQLKERQEDERILGIDLAACTPAQRVYYEALQEEIFEKIAARRMKRRA